jgi:hypothetical protein
LLPQKALELVKRQRVEIEKLKEKNDESQST